MISAFITAIVTLAEEARHIIIWADNCSAQNKNWFLFTSLIRILNDKNLKYPIDSATFKYLGTGHTYMSCDSFHGHVEKKMRSLGSLYNFRDLVYAIQTAAGLGAKTILLECKDFTVINTSCPGSMRNVQMQLYTKQKS